MADGGNSPWSGTLGMLQVAFVVMKLLELGPVGRWSWWWVMAPTWIPVVIVSLFMAFVGILMFLDKRNRS